MNIMIIIPSLSGGGAERAASVLASELCKKHTVTVVTYYSTDKDYVIDKNVSVKCLEISGGSNGIKKAVNCINRIRILKKLKKDLAIDCSISFLYAPNFENVMSRNNEKTIVSLRNKYSVNYKGFKGKINSYTCKKADLSVALSKNVMYDQIVNYGTPENKIITIYNPCNIELINEMAGEPVPDQMFMSIRERFDRVIINAGRLNGQKGQWHLIRSFKEVIKKHPSTALVILGEGELRPYLKSLIRDSGLSDNVFLLGFHPNPYPFLKKSDIFAFTSLYEGFGNILLEAMACGLPVISCDCDAGPRELMAPDSDIRCFADHVQLEQYGILTKVMDGTRYKADDPISEEEKMFAEGINKMLDEEELLNHYSLRSGKRIRDFSKEIIAEEWEKILR